MTSAHTNRAPDLRDHMLRTYATLRGALFVAGVGLPLVLLIGSWILRMPVQDSMSQYYHADRDFRPTEEQRATLTEAARIRDALAKAHRDPSAMEKETLKAATELDATLFSRPGAGEWRDWFVGGLFIVGIFSPTESARLMPAPYFAVHRPGVRVARRGR